MHRLSGGAKPPEQSSVELGERVPHVHHDSEAPQGCAHLKICAEQFLPGCAYRLGHLGVAVAGKIDEESLHAKRVEIDESGASRVLAPECDSAARERVDGACFARVRPAGKSDLTSARRDMLELGCALEKGRIAEKRHGQ